MGNKASSAQNNTPLPEARPPVIPETDIAGKSSSTVSPADVDRSEDSGVTETVAYDSQGEDAPDDRTPSMRLDSALQHELLSGWSQFKNAKDYSAAPKDKEEGVRVSLRPDDQEVAGASADSLPAPEVVHSSSTKTSSAHYEGELNAEGRKHGEALLDE